MYIYIYIYIYISVCVCVCALRHTHGKVTFPEKGKIDNKDRLI